MLDRHREQVDGRQRQCPYAAIAAGVTPLTGLILSRTLAACRRNAHERRAPLPGGIVSVDGAGRADGGLGGRRGAAQIEGQATAAWGAGAVEVEDGPVWVDEVAQVVVAVAAATTAVGLAPVGLVGGRGQRGQEVDEEGDDKALCFGHFLLIHLGFWGGGSPVDEGRPSNTQEATHLAFTLLTTQFRLTVQDLFPSGGKVGLCSRLARGCNVTTDIV